MIKFEETRNRIREFCQEFYKVDSEGFVTKNGDRIDSYIVINDMIRNNKLSKDELINLIEGK